MTNFEVKMLIVIATYHRYTFKEIKDVYLKIRQFDKVITLINFADEYNRSLSYMADLFMELIAKRHSAFEWINWAGQNNKLKDTIKETLQQK